MHRSFPCTHYRGNSLFKGRVNKQFAGGGQSELQLDWAQTDPTLAAETRLGILAGWVLAAEAAGLRYGLCLPGSNQAPAAGDRHRQACLETLALYQP